MHDRIFAQDMAKAQGLSYCPNGKKVTWIKGTLRLRYPSYKFFRLRSGYLDLFPSYGLWVITGGQCLGCRVASLCWVEQKKGPLLYLTF